MAELQAARLIERLKAVHPVSHSLMWTLGGDLAQHLGVQPFHITGSDNPVLSVDAAMQLVRQGLGRHRSDVFMTLTGVMNPPHELWRAEISRPGQRYHGRAKTAALALCVALLRAHEGGEAGGDQDISRVHNTETFPGSDGDISP
jgi:hypothetical protein